MNIYLDEKFPSQPQPASDSAISASAICFYCVYLNKATKMPYAVYVQCGVIDLNNIGNIHY